MITVSRRTFLAASALSVCAIAAAGVTAPLGATGMTTVTARSAAAPSKPGTPPAAGEADPDVDPRPVVTGGSQPVRRSAYPVLLESKRRGTRAWDADQDDSPAVEGYLSATSAAPGEVVELHLGRGPGWRGDGRLTVEWYRLGWYGGAGGRLMRTNTVSSVRGTPKPVPDPKTGVVEASWKPALRVAIGADWPSGVYLAVLRPKVGAPGYVPFIVRPPKGAADPAPVLFVSAAATWQAYNTWGGKSLYDSPSSGPVMPWGSNRAAVVSFDRPYLSNHGAGLLFSWELQFVRWQERRLRDVEYASDVDLELHPEVLEGRRLLLFVGHHEYWSRPMRTALEAAVAKGTNVAFIGANDMYWQARLEASPSGRPARRVVCYRLAAFDPLAKKSPKLVTVQWRDGILDEAEAGLIGQMYAHIVARPADWVVKDADHWVYAGTGLKDGDHLANLVGQEYDSVELGGSPKGVQVIARSPVVPNQRGTLPDVHTATVYQAASGATIFSAGTFQWAWALDSFGSRTHMGIRTPTDKRVEIMTANLLTRLGDGPAPQMGPPSTPTGADIGAGGGAASGAASGAGSGARAEGTT